MFVKRISLWVFTLLLLLSQAVQSEVYKWTDENGKVHFGDRPPVEQETEQVEVSTVATPNGAMSDSEDAVSPADNNANRQETRQRLLDQYAKERDEKRQAAQKQREDKARRKANCAMAKDRLRNLQEHARLYELDANGERRYYSSAEREQALAQGKAEVKQWCN